MISGPKQKNWPFVAIQLSHGSYNVWGDLSTRNTQQAISIGQCIFKKGVERVVNLESYMEVVLDSFYCRLFKTAQNFQESNAKAIRSHVIHYWWDEPRCLLPFNLNNLICQAQVIKICLYIPQGSIYTSWIWNIPWNQDNMYQNWLPEDNSF